MDVEKPSDKTQPTHTHTLSVAMSAQVIPAWGLGARREIKCRCEMPMKSKKDTKGSRAASAAKAKGKGRGKGGKGKAKAAAKASAQGRQGRGRQGQGRRRARTTGGTAPLGEARATCAKRMGEMLRWAPRMVQELDDFAMHRLQQIFSAQTRLTTSYSGIGFFEMTYDCLKDQIAPMASPLEVYSACDNNVDCQAVLLHATGPTAAAHVFSDITHTFSQEDMARLDLIQKQFQAQVDMNMNIRGMTRHEAVREVGSDMLDSMDVVMRKAKLQMTAPCVRCGSECTLKPPPASSDVLTGNAAGSVCVEFSSRGKQMGLVGSMVKVWLCWMYQRLAWIEDEDFIFHECTSTHPTKFLMERYLDRTHWIWTFVLSPEMFAWPATRRRRMCIAVSKRFVMRTHSVPRTPAVLFKIMASDYSHSSIFWCATDAEVGAEPSTLTPAQHRRLKEFQGWVEDRRASGEEWVDAFYDVTQSLAYCKKAKRRIGCLLTKTLWWSHADNRAMHAREALQVMGLPMLGAVVEEAGWKPPFGNVMDSMTPSTIRRFAGNGLNMPCVAALLLWCWGHAVDAPPESPWPSGQMAAQAASRQVATP